MKKLRIAGIGCGGRTRTYFDLAAALPERYEVVAGADPISERVEDSRRLSRNPEFRGFKSDVEMLAEPKLADIMIIGTQDAHHAGPCIAAMVKGYDILLEKPIAQQMSEVVTIERRARELGRRVLVCHVLRYAPFYTRIREIIDSGALGDIVTLNAVEGVEPWHQAHSYVRGHWGVSEKSTPMIIAKSCHDMDVLSWLVGRHCEAVSSFGQLSHFTAEHAPAGAPARCTDGCPASTMCMFNAMHYAGKHRFWMTFVHPNPDTSKLTPQDIVEWLKTCPWGRCVYRCDNTAVDHQVVNMAFEGGITATFTMTAFAHGRELEICGTKARLVGGHWHEGHRGHDIVVTEHGTGNETRYKVSQEIGGYAGHGGGDPGLMLALHDEMLRAKPEDMRSSIHRSIESHAMGFAAEQSRRTGQTVRLKDFYAQFK
jgi:predicted dehydrogenase